MPLQQITLDEAQIAQRLIKTQGTETQAHFADLPYQRGLLRGDPKPAAVLLPLLRENGLWHLLFTRRNASLPEHSGQVAFPGGRTDPGDSSPEATALREAQEEIGVKPTDVRILGKLPTFLTITNYMVTPVVCVMPWPYALHLATNEVTRAFTIPMDWLADPNHYEERQRSLPPPFSPIPVIYYQPYDGEVLWGASARMTLRLLAILGLSNDTQ